MEIEVRTAGGVQILRPTLSRLTAVSGADGLDQSIRQAIADGNLAIAINMTEVEYADSTAIGALIRGYKQLATGQGTLCLFGVGEELREFFRQTVLDRLIDIEPDEQSALQMFEGQPKKRRKGIWNIFR